MIHEKLAEIQRTLKAPKSNFNAFGKYKYRSAEDILEAVKPLLGETILTLTDELVLIGDRYYVKASAILCGSIPNEFVMAQAYAREEDTKKGMDAAQITGAASSYARKYCLSGLFLLDDTKDPDATNTHDSKPVEASKTPDPTPTMTQPPNVDSKPANTVTEAQIKRLFTIANASDKSKAEIKEWLSAHGLSSSKELTSGLYDMLVIWIQEPKQTQEDHPPMGIVCPDGVQRPITYCDDACPIPGPCPNRPGE